MIKIGIIGLGDIAQKAYLPLFSNKNAEVHLYSRDDAKLSRLAEAYRFEYFHPSLGSLINSGIEGAIVSTSTESHAEIVEQLLQNNIHVYVDKPISYDLSSAEKLINLSKEKKLILTVGFNRRFAPAIQRLKEIKDPNMIVMQKNRMSLPGEIRKFIFDDFIHVVDTILYLFPEKVEKLVVSGKKKNSLLYHVVVQFFSKTNAMAIGIMNRDAGVTEETTEVFSSAEKRIVYNLTDTVIFKNKIETRISFDDWETTLYKRGFESMVNEFLTALKSDHPHEYYKTDSLLTHRLCEDIVDQLEAAG